MKANARKRTFDDNILDESVSSVIIDAICYNDLLMLFELSIRINRKFKMVFKEIFTAYEKFNNIIYKYENFLFK